MQFIIYNEVYNHELNNNNEVKRQYKTMLRYLYRNTHFDPISGKLKFSDREEEATDMKNALIGIELETGLDYDDEDDYYIIDRIEETLGIESYRDYSCGAEFPTRPMKIKDIAPTIKKFASLCPRDQRAPSVGAGGHFNISVPNWKLYIKPYFIALRTYIPFLAGVLNSSYTHKRQSRFRYMLSDIMTDWRQILEKYHWFHYKNYAIEYRVPDTAFDENTITTYAYTVLGILYEVINGRHPPSNVYFNSEAQRGLYYDKIENGTMHIDEDYFRNLYHTLRQWLKWWDTYLYEQYDIDYFGMLKAEVDKAIEYRRLVFEDIDIEVVKNVVLD